MSGWSGRGAPLQHRKSWFRVLPSVAPLLNRSKHCFCSTRSQAKTCLTPGGAGCSSRGAFAPAPRSSNPWSLTRRSGLDRMEQKHSADVLFIGASFYVNLAGFSDPWKRPLARYLLLETLPSSGENTQLRRQVASPGPISIWRCTKF